MAAVRVWRRVTFWLWLSCLALAVYSLPVNEEDSSASVTKADQSDLGPAIEAIERARAKRDSRKKSSKSGRSLVRYRYPIHVKRSGDAVDYDMDDETDEERGDPLAALLMGPNESDLTGDTPVNIEDLAKEMALDILMEELEKERISEHRSTALHMKKKKAAPTAHRPRFSLDDKRRKRMNSIVNQLLDEDDLDDQDNEYAGPADNNDDTLLDDDDGADDDDDNLIQNAMMKALANQGLDPNDIDALLSELERFQVPAASADDQFELESKKKRNSEWRKLPRASLRWRFLHGVGDNELQHGRHHHNDDEDEVQDKSIPFENRFFGRGFHRVGPSIPDDSNRGSAVTAKRVQHPLKTKNVVSNVNKRSIDVRKKGEESSSAPLVRRRRSYLTDATEVKSKLNQTTPPLALPSTETKNLSQLDNKQQATNSKASPTHSGVIRKKSVDWDDYFGYDKRSNKGNSHLDNDVVDDDDEEAAAMRDFLESEYYKSLAGSLAFRKRGQMESHAGHVGGMRKRSNGTVSMQKKRRNSSGKQLEDVEEALDAAYKAMQERRDYDDVAREQLIAELIDNLDEEELDEMTERLSEELIDAIRTEELENGGNQLDDDDDEPMKRSSGNTLKHKKKKKSLKDERRKRFAVKRSQNARINAHQSDEEDDCVIAEQVLVTCNMVSHLYGGYRPVLSDACFRHQACFICSDNEAACDVEYQQRVLSLCGPDLLCQSQSRHLLSALGQLDQMEEDYLNPLGGRARIDSLCRRDSCLAGFLKKR